MVFQGLLKNSQTHYSCRTCGIYITLWPHSELVKPGYFKVVWVNGEDIPYIYRYMEYIYMPFVYVFLFFHWILSYFFFTFSLPFSTISLSICMSPFHCLSVWVHSSDCGVVSLISGAARVNQNLNSTSQRLTNSLRM